MTKSKTTTITFVGIFSALIILMTFTPIGYLTFGAISATLIHIPVIVGAVLFGPVSGMILGLVWGVSCVIRAATMGVALDLLFINPLVSVLPRVIVGLLAGLVFRGLVKCLSSRPGSEIIAATVSGAVGTLTNTVLVLGMLFLIYRNNDMITAMIDGGSSLGYIIGTILSVNGLIEILAAVILVPAISKALLSVKKRMKA